MTKGDLARQNFKSGYNCSQAVALAFQDKIGMDPDTIARLTIGFGGGMGRMREVCGTISGVTFVLSALYGDRPKSEVYAMAEPRTDGYYKKRPCAELCALAADLLEDYLKNIT